VQLGSPEIAFIFAFWALLSLVVIWPAGRICMRAGLSPYLGILAVVPFVNLFLLWYVAYADWPGSSSRPSAS
jgi:hypothetical protein